MDYGLGEFEREIDHLSRAVSVEYHLMPERVKKAERADSWGCLIKLKTAKWCKCAGSGFERDSSTKGDSCGAFER